MTNYDPTDEEVEAIEFAGLEAAWKVLQPLRDEINPSIGMRFCLKAFESARAAIFEATLKLKKERQCKYVNHCENLTLIVASALAAIDLDEISDSAANSIGGGQIAMFCKAAKAMESLSSVYDAFDDNDEVFGTWLSEELVKIADAKS